MAIETSISCDRCGLRSNYEGCVARQRLHERSGIREASNGYMLCLDCVDIERRELEESQHNN